MRLFRQFMENTANAVLTHRVLATKEDTADQKGNLTKNCQVISYLPATYATDDVITEVKASVINLK